MSSFIGGWGGMGMVKNGYTWEYLWFWEISTTLLDIGNDDVNPYVIYLTILFWYSH